MSEKIPHLFSPFRDTFPITQIFGVMEPYRGGSIRHEGVDYGAPCGTPIYASIPGIITAAVLDKSKGGYGNRIEQTLGDVTVLYAHLSQVYVRTGQAVKAGEPIGLTGNSGYVLGRTGCHLHFALKLRGIYINPTPFMANENNEPRVIPEPSDNKVAVLRLYNPETKDHFYTTDGAEADNAIQTLGYKYEGVLGYVFATV